MIKLDLQLLKQQNQSQAMSNLEKKVVELYSDVTRSEKNEFSLLAGRLLAALTSGDSEGLEFVADHLAISCKTLDDLKGLMYNAGVLMPALDERYNAARGE